MERLHSIRLQICESITKLFNSFNSNPSVNSQQIYQMATFSSNSYEMCLVPTNEQGLHLIHWTQITRRWKQVYSKNVTAMIWPLNRRTHYSSQNHGLVTIFSISKYRWAEMALIPLFKKVETWGLVAFNRNLSPHCQDIDFNRHYRFCCPRDWEFSAVSFLNSQLLQ